MSGFDKVVMDTITLDLDGYQLGFIQYNYKRFIDSLKEIDAQVDINEITVYEGKKGLNVVFKLVKEISFKENMFCRLILFDDLFRLRADVLKFMKNQTHRLNRIWIYKDDFAKEIVYSEIDVNLTGLGEFEKQFKTIVENKTKILKELKGGNNDK